MKKSRKLSSCLNCGKKLTDADNFCSFCGQENKDQKVSILRFTQDFLSNYLNFETVFFQTLPAFLLHPGRLTITFNEGKRRKYIHPIRLYLITSLFYFFVIALVIPVDLVDRFMSGEITAEQIAQDSDGMVRINTEAASTFDSLKHSGQLDELKKLGIPQDSMQMSGQSLTELDKSEQDTAAKAQSEWRKLRALSLDPDITESAFDTALAKSPFDVSLGLDNALKRKFIANSSLFITNAAQNLPIMMFLLLPFFAFLLWLVNFRSKKYYVEHLIHGLHLHAFAYLVYGTAILWMAKVKLGFSISFLLAFVVVTAYAYFSMKNVSKQGWFKTLLKFWTIGLLYLTALVLAVTLELYLSLVTF